MRLIKAKDGTVEKYFNIGETITDGDKYTGIVRQIAFGRYEMGWGKFKEGRGYDSYGSISQKEAQEFNLVAGDPTKIAIPVDTVDMVYFNKGDIITGIIGKNGWTKSSGRWHGEILEVIDEGREYKVGWGEGSVLGRFSTTFNICYAYAQRYQLIGNNAEQDTTRKGDTFEMPEPKPTEKKLDRTMELAYMLDGAGESLKDTLHSIVKETNKMAGEFIDGVPADDYQRKKRVRELESFIHVIEGRLKLVDNSKKVIQMALDHNKQLKSGKPSSKSSSGVIDGASAYLNSSMEHL